MYRVDQNKNTWLACCWDVHKTDSEKIMIKTIPEIKHD